MNRLKIYIAVQLLASCVVTGASGAVEISLEQSPNPIGLNFSDEPFCVRVTVGAWDQAESSVVSHDWATKVEWVAVDSTGRSVIPTADLAFVLQESCTAVVTSFQTERGNWWSSKASVAVWLPSAGSFSLVARFHGITSAPHAIKVLKGDESPEVASKMLLRDSWRPGTSFERFRELQLKRLELVPTDESILWVLAEVAANAPGTTRVEVDSYFARTIAVGNARMSTWFASGEWLPGDVIESWQNLVEMRTEVAAAYHELLPQRLENPEHLRILWDAMGGEVRLQDTESLRSIRSICVPRCCPASV